MATQDYTIVVLLRGGSLRHFHLMLRSLQLQSILPVQVLFLGLPSTPSALAQAATRRPIPLEIEQNTLWCLNSTQRNEVFNWSLLEVIQQHAKAPVVIVTESNILFEREFARTHIELAQPRTIVTGFPATLSPLLSATLDDSTLERGEPFRSWLSVVFDSIVGQSQHGLRLMPLPLWKRVTEPFLRVELSSTSLSFQRETLERMLLLCQECVNLSLRKLLACAGIRYCRATHMARHVQLTELHSHVFVLAPVAESQWTSVPLPRLSIRPVLHRHQLN